MKNDLPKILKSYDFHNGRMICGSKSAYVQKFPNNQVVFNANIVSKLGKIFYGDIDLTLDSENLQKVASESGEMFLVLSEMDCRFDTENDSFENLEKKAVAIFRP